MFSAKGNPSMDNLAAVVQALRDDLHLTIAVVSKARPGAARVPRITPARSRNTFEPGTRSTP
jgi:hypothetical protein